MRDYPGILEAISGARDDGCNGQLYQLCASCLCHLRAVGRLESVCEHIANDIEDPSFGLRSEVLRFYCFNADQNGETF